jgi:hypothetical protein
VIDVQRRIDLFNQGYWEIPDNLDTTNFDFNWRPDPYDRPYIHQFGTQWQKTGGPRFIIPENEGIKYQECQHCIQLPRTDSRNWRPLKANVRMDYSWHPDDTVPPFIYVFGNQWYDSTTMPTIQYRVKGATEKKYITDVTATLLPDLENWVTPDDIEDDFDYSWVPSPHEPPFVYQFGTQHQKTGGPTYLVRGADTVKYIDTIKATKKVNMRNWRIPELIEDSFDFSWHPDDTEPPFNYEFATQHQCNGGPIYVTRGATVTKETNAQIAIRKPNMRMWRIPEPIEMDFDFSWHPDNNEPPYIYHFATQWQRNGGPIYVVKGATEIKYIDVQKAIRKSNSRNWRPLELIEDSFDYSWHPDDTEEPYNYVFGNEYYTPEHMPTIMYRVRDAIDTKYIENPKAKLKIRVVEYVDSIFDSVLSNHQNLDAKFTYHTTNSSIDYSTYIKDSDKFYLHIIDGLSAIVPYEARIHLHDKLTDYPYVRYHRTGARPEPLDIVFFSNGETCADDNYKHLQELVKRLPNRLVRVDGVNGRVASQHAAANNSNTPWYFLVNAKLKVDKDFDFNWQPNRIARGKHYIFRATNPVNGLEYGHQAIVANNKRLTLNTLAKGLDFTMDSPHEIVDINSGVAMYNSSEWDTWRTAFRECIKLCNSNDTESKDRLLAWQEGTGQFSEYSIKGAKDAIEYYESVNGEFSELMKSYDWAWLKTYYTR